MILERKCTEWQQQQESCTLIFYSFTDSVALAIIIIITEKTDLECVSFLLSMTT